MFVVLHRDFFSFVIFFFCNIKNAPLPQDVLCFSGRVAVSPPPTPQRAATLTARSAGVSTGGRAGGRAAGTLPGGARGAERGGVIYTGVRLRTTHIVFLQSSSLLGFCFFLFAKISVLNKCRLFAVLFSSCRRRSWGWGGGPPASTWSQLRPCSGRRQTQSLCRGRDALARLRWVARQGAALRSTEGREKDGQEGRRGGGVTEAEALR